MSKKIKARFPPQYATNLNVNGNPIRQVVRVGVEVDVTTGKFASDTNRKGIILTASDGATTLVIEKEEQPSFPFDAVLIAKKLTYVTKPTEGLPNRAMPYWLRPVHSSDPRPSKEARVRARASWASAFSFRREKVMADGTVISGLRGPQIGAVHAVLGHWAVSDEIATVVMPTGTGKTETMLALLACEDIGCLLVIVPTDPLRTQIARKFESFGMIKAARVLDESAHYPVVGTLLHVLEDTSQVDEVFQRCNVVVTTAAIANQCGDSIRAHMALLTTHLFIDEAHHVPAKSWKNIRNSFSNSRVVQFTATPFRRDGELVDGVRVFNFPLRRAQAENLFTQITLKSVAEFAPELADNSIAVAALSQLDEDLAAGFDHLLMARVNTINRANVVLETYRRLAPNHNPIAVYHSQSSAAQRSHLASLLNRRSRVVVCVGMLGEGFDLPALKIAALHDVHRSLTVTLQFIGRFTRASGLGKATVVANTADARVDDALKDLYQESADWNHIIRDLSESATERHRERTEFIQSLGDFTSSLPLQSVAPKMSTVVYRTKCKQWQPDKLLEEPWTSRIFSGPLQSKARHVALYATRECEQIAWAPIKEPTNISWHIYIAHWDDKRGLLFVHSSNHDSQHEQLAKALAGSDVDLISGEPLLRVLEGINLLSLMNIGLKHSLNRANRFVMYVGSDVIQGIEEATASNSRITNLFGKGYENGLPATIGCSLKGRIWSYRVAEDVTEWLLWCKHIGTKLSSTGSSVQSILRTVLRPEELNARPSLVPVVIEWPDVLLERSEDVTQIELGGNKTSLLDCDILLTDHNDSGPLSFSIVAGEKSADYIVVFRDSSVHYVRTKGYSATLIQSRKRKPIEEYLGAHPPIIRFTNGAFLDGRWLLTPSDTWSPFDRNRIINWDWRGTNIKSESQGISKNADSVQWRVIDETRRAPFGVEYSVIFDDDGSGEIADVVAIALIDDRKLIVHLFHCKFSVGANAGARVEDLYVVCGQAQKSVPWKSKAERMLTHLLRRDAKRRISAGVSRFEKGTESILRTLRNRVRFLDVEFRIFVVQPGLSRSKATEQQLDLLAATATYLRKTFAVNLDVIGSD